MISKGHLQILFCSRFESAKHTMRTFDEPELRYWMEKMRSLLPAWKINFFISTWLIFSLQLHIFKSTFIVQTNFEIPERLICHRFSHNCCQPWRCSEIFFPTGLSEYTFSNLILDKLSTTTFKLLLKLLVSILVDQTDHTYRNTAVTQLLTREVKTVVHELQGAQSNTLHTVYQWISN